MNDGYGGGVTVHQQSPGLVLTALVVCFYSFLSQSMDILELRRGDEILSRTILIFLGK